MTTGIIRQTLCLLVVFAVLAPPLFAAAKSKADQEREARWQEAKKKAEERKKEEEIRKKEAEVRKKEEEIRRAEAKKLSVEGRLSAFPKADMVSIDDFHKRRATTIAVFNASAVLSDYYNWEFSDTRLSHWSVKIVAGKDDEDIGNGFVEKASEVGRQLYNVLKDGKKHDLIVALRYSVNAKDAGVFHIIDFKLPEKESNQKKDKTENAGSSTTNNPPAP